ncbi:MAG TPA: phosphomannomutase/phosphoglucomutase [Gemmatimonadales bacterium]|nr:phosphomannomutase/phosphoglucomutase [Gemmatimonadales bacterium]
MTVSPVIFRQYDVRGTVGVDLTPEVALALGRAIAAEALERLGRAPTLVVGRDNRPSGESLGKALIAGLRAGGVNVRAVGQVPTPALYFAIHHLAADGGVQVTGSHNPPEFNGFKMVLAGAPLAGDDIQALRSRIESARFSEGQGSLEAQAVLDAYVAEITGRLGVLPRPVRVVVDCGNGVPSLVAPRLLRALGAEVTELFCESDGSFPNHHPDPTVLENLRDLIAAVGAGGADLGVAFDGDGDRIGAVDERGDVLPGDLLLVLYGRDLVRRLGPGREVIFDVKCSDLLPHALEQAGAKPVMWMTGHSHIKKRMKQTGAPLAGEMSGHMFFGAPDYLGFDDALYAAARLLHIVAASGSPLSSHLADLPRLVATPEIRVDCSEGAKWSAVEAAAAYFRSRYETVTIDGVRWRAHGGWGLIRASNTQPILVLRFEAPTLEQLERIRAEAFEVLTAQGVRPPEL